MPFRRLTTARLIDGSAQPNERLRQACLDRLLVEAQMLSDLVQRHPGAAMEEEDIATIARQATDRPDENPALVVFV